MIIVVVVMVVVMITRRNLGMRLSAPHRAPPFPIPPFTASYHQRHTIRLSLYRFTIFYQSLKFSFFYGLIRINCGVCFIFFGSQGKQHFRDKKCRSLTFSLKTASNFEFIAMTSIYKGHLNQAFSVLLLLSFWLNFTSSGSL